MTFPNRWHTNEAIEDVPSCTFFDSEPIDLEAALGGLGDFPPIGIRSLPTWFGSHAGALTDGDRAVLERILIRLEFIE